MHTSGMKLTTLFLSLMLASSALGAPVPPPKGVPAVNMPTVGSGVIEDNTPAGTMDKVNDGLKGNVKPPQTKADPVADATDAAAEGNAEPAKGLHSRQEPDVGALLDALLGGSDPTSGLTGGTGSSNPTSGLTGGAGSSNPTSGLTGGAGSSNPTSGLTGKRSAGPPSIDHTGISHEINQATSRASGNSKRSPDGLIPGVNTLDNSRVGGDKVKDVVDGKTAPLSGTTGTLGTRGEKKKCVNGLDLTHDAIPCMSDNVAGGVDPNSVNDLNGAAKGATAGKTGAPKTEAPKAGTETVTGSDLGSEFVPSADSVTASPTDTKTPTTGDVKAPTTGDVKAPTTGDITGADAVSGLTSGFVPRGVDETVKKVNGAAADLKKTTGTGADVASVDTPLGAKTVPV
jgi:hypothetical protein